MGQLFSRIRRDGTAPEEVTRRQGETDNDDPCVVQRYSKHTGPFFGSHFLMGGERYEVSKPEAFLFGENADLDFLDSRPVQFPYIRQPVTDPVKTLNVLINLRRDSVKLVKTTEKNGEDDEEPKDYFNVEFYFDCDSACYVQIHFFATEVIRNGRIQFLYQYPDLKPSPQYYFDVGPEQHFNRYIINPDMFTSYNMHYESGAYFPVVIELHTVECGVEQVQTTMASVNLSTDQNATYVMKPMKQKLIADGVVYLLQEIYGIENKEHDLNDENGSECIICLSDIRDTVILPCRHLCICNGCAETLRYRQNNCPICRSPFRALLQLKTMRVVSTVSITDQSSSTQQTRSQTRYETMTLVEALNGPISHIQSCIVPTVPLASENDSAYDSSAAINQSPTKTPKEARTVLSASDQNSEADENTVYIEMKPATEFVHQISYDEDSDVASVSESFHDHSAAGSQRIEVEIDENAEELRPNVVEVTGSLSCCSRRSSKRQ